MTYRTTPTSTQAADAAKAVPATLSRDLANFLVELSIAFHKHAIYPMGHPLLNSAVDSVTSKLQGLLADRSSLSIGIARRQLIIEGVATDPDHPLLQELANKLHRHHLGAVKFNAGITKAELSDALATLAVDAGRMQQPLGLTADEVSKRWEHVRIFPLTYDKLELLDESGEPKEDEEAEGAEGQMRAGRAAQLWVGLARAALAADTANAGAEDDGKALEPVAVAKAIEEHQREKAYDQVIVGYMLQIADELKTARTAESAALQRRISKMVGALQPDTLGRLLEMSGDNQQRRRFVLDATQGMAVDAVVELVQAAADAEHQTISHSLVRLFNKLARHTADTDITRRTMADQSLREHVRRLIDDWSLDDPNPGAYSLVLQEMSRQAPAVRNGDATTISLVCEPDRILKMGLEVGILGHRVEHAVGLMLEEHQWAELLDIMEEAPEGSPTDAVWQQVEQSGALRAALETERVDFGLVARMAKRMRLAAVTPLLDAMESQEEGGKANERLVDILASIGDDVGPALVRRLPTAPAPMQRDLLAMISRLPAVPRGLDLVEYAEHPEAMVRREAVRLLLRQDATRTDAIVAAVADPDNRTAFLALTAAQERCPAGAAPIIMRRVDRGDMEPALRALGIRAVAGRRDPDNLPWLVGHVQRRSRWLRRLQLQPKSPEMLAALTALAAYWRENPEAKGALALAAKSNDAEVRQALTSPRVTGGMRAVT